MDLYVSLASFLFLSVLLILFKKSKRVKLPPGPMPLPIIGNLHQIYGALPHRILTDLARKHGPLMHLKLGEVSTVVVSSAEVAKEVMKDHDLVFASRPRFLFSIILNYDCQDIAYSPYGDSWRQLRKICSMELLNARRVLSYRPIREEEATNTMKSISSLKGTPVNLTRMLYSLTYTIIARCAFGKRSKHHDHYIAFMEDVIKMMGAFSVVDWYPSIKILERLTGIRKKLMDLQTEVDTVLTTIIDEHKQKRAQPKTGNEEEREDLVDVLLNLRESGELGASLNDDNVKGALYDVFSGGGETSSRTLIWSMLEMMRQPAILKKAQDEVRQVVGDKGIVEEAQLGELKYLRSVVKETLRLHPSGPLAVPRECSEDCEIAGYVIPAGARVIVNVFAIGRDPNHWTDPETYIPERFLDSDIDFLGKNFSYLPFGGGRRICPGITLAMRNIELPLANLLYHFDWSLPGEMKPEDLDMTEVFGLTVGPRDELKFVPTPYHLSAFA